MKRPLVVDVDGNGTAAVYVPVFGLWNILQWLPCGLAVITYHYPTRQAQVSFPGLRPGIAQQIIDAALMKEDETSSPQREF